MPADGGQAAAFAAEPKTEQLEFFEKKIRPALTEHCYSCHSADAQKNKTLYRETDHVKTFYRVNGYPKS